MGVPGPSQCFRSFTHLGRFSVYYQTKEQCARDLQNYIFMCDYLGVPLAPEKLVGPDTVLQFAGITLDSVLFEARLPEDMLAKCRVMLHNFYTRGTVTLKELHGRY